MMMLVAVVLTAAATALAGPISFIALVAPHIARRISGTSRWGLTLSALCGALLLLMADLCAQQLFMPYQLPVGVVTVSLGGIYLIVLLIQESRKNDRISSPFAWRPVNVGLWQVYRGGKPQCVDSRRPFHRDYRAKRLRKSTLLRTLSRLMTPVHGKVWLDGEHIQHYASKEVARRIGLLAQNATTPGILRYRSWLPADATHTSRCLPAGGKRMKLRSQTPCRRRVSPTWHHKVWIPFPADNVSVHGLRWCWRRKRRLCCSMNPPLAGYQSSDRSAGTAE